MPGGGNLVTSSSRQIVHLAIIDGRSCVKSGPSLRQGHARLQRYPDAVRITEIATNPTDAERAIALEFVTDVERAVGTPQLSDHLRLDLARPHEPGGVGPTLVTIRESDGGVIAVAELAAANDASVLEVVVPPDLADATTVRDDAVETIIDSHRRRDASAVVWWLDDPSDHDRTVAERLGLAMWRELYEMRRPLPHPDRATVTTRDFRPGVDDEAWLRVNNRAFAAHGEQGGWTLETLRLRLHEPWFDPAGFRILDDERRTGEIAAFCWTKVHAEETPPVGEIYVIAVDPTAHSRGLGKQLTLAGLDSIADRGITVANLYVDAGNDAAVGLYDRLGFTIHRRRVAFAAPEHHARTTDATTAPDGDTSP
jgi:mycothiol synthase